jgi:hypothetical protein
MAGAAVEESMGPVTQVTSSSPSGDQISEYNAGITTGRGN